MDNNIMLTCFHVISIHIPLCLTKFQKSLFVTTALLPPHVSLSSLMPWSLLAPRTGQALKSGTCSLNSLFWDSVDHSRHFLCQNLLDTRNNSTYGHHQMVNTQIRLIIFFAAKNGEAVYSQQKQDQWLTVAQIIGSVLQNFGSNLRK